MRLTRLYIAALIAAALVSPGVMATTIGEAKAAGPGWSGYLQGFVTALFPDYNSFVIEESSRSAAITVTPITIPLDIGNEVVVNGSIEADGTFLSTLTQTTGFSSSVWALATANRSMAGAVAAPGLATTDMFLTGWGRVLDYRNLYPDGSMRFHITDGSATASGASVTVIGGTVNSDAVQVAVPPSVRGTYPVVPGNYVTVSGISGRGQTIDGALRCLTIGGTSDLVRIPVGGEIVEKGLFPPIVAAFDGTGDFGPETPGTTTCGLQEAINSCVSSGRNLYIKGEDVYRISTPLYIPPARRFTIDGGNYVIDWTGPQDTPDDMVVIDSARDCHYRLGLLVYEGSGAGLRVKPAHPIPSDGSTIFTDSEIRLECSIGKHPFGGAVRDNYVSFDTSSGPIVYSDFFLIASNNVLTSDSGWDFAHNRLYCQHIAGGEHSSVILSLGGTCKQNEITVILELGFAGVKGIDLYGSNNLLNVVSVGGFGSPTELVLEPPAAGNQINYMTGFTDPFGLITDLASNPTNTVTWAGGQSAIRAVAATEGLFTYTQRLCPATVRVVGGTVSDTVLRRSGTTVDYGASRGDILMSAGDELDVISASAPSILVIPMKAR